MADHQVLSEKDREIYKNVSRFVYSQGVVTIEEVEQKCRLLSFEAWRTINVLIAVGIVSERDGAIRVWGSPASSEDFDAMVVDGLADVDAAILAAAETDSREDASLSQSHRRGIALEMMSRCPEDVHAAHVEICERLFRGERRSAILDACDRLGIPETGVWLSTRLMPIPPSEKGFVS